MKISVIMPCHNAERWIGQALCSAAEQTRSPDEVIVIDDGSTDDSVGQVERSGVAVKLLRCDCRNAAAARNHGIEHATGDWIAFLDADDLWLPHHLEQAHDLLAAGGDVAYMEHQDWTDIHGRIEHRPACHALPQPEAGMTDRRFMTHFALHGLGFAMSSVLVRRDRFEQAGRFDADQVRRHDMEMWLRVAAGHTWAYHPRVGSLYRRDTPGSISSQAVNCKYWRLRGLLKNRQLYPQPEMDRLVRRAARAAMRSALVRGDAQDRRLAWTLARPHLPWRFRAWYGLSRRVPALHAR